VYVVTGRKLRKVMLLQLLPRHGVLLGLLSLLLVFIVAFLMLLLLRSIALYSLSEKMTNAD
jgi:hypothetical protein